MTHFDLDTHDQPSPQSDESAEAIGSARVPDAPIPNPARAADSAPPYLAPTSAVVLHQDAPLFRFGH